MPDKPHYYNAIGKILAYRRAQTPNRPALRFGDEIMTYADLDDAVNRTANGLTALGIGKGTHVGLMMDNRLEFIVSVYALAKLGAVGIPFNTTLFGPILSYFVEDSEVTAVIAHGRHAETLLKLPAARANIRTWIVADPGAAAIKTDDARATTLDAIQTGASAEAPEVEVEATDPFMILYTSGTTGPSKGVVCPHSHLHWISEIAARRIDLTEEDKFYACLPLFHVAALWYCVGACIWAGACAVIAERFSASNFWSDICRTGSTATMIAMSMSIILEKLEPTEAEKSNPVRVAWLVPVPPDIRRFETRFGLKIATNYSMTEITHAAVGLPGRFYDRPPGCVGPLSGDWDVMIADENDRPMAPNAAGEILVRPRKPGILFQGYYRKERATVAQWRNLWFHTGDRGYFDDEGYLYFVDRVKDAIRRRGENISAYEIENVLLAFPGVQEVAAVPVPSPLGEDDLCIYVMAKSGVTLREEEIVRFAQESLPYFMVPRYVALVDDLPRTPSLKVQKFVLRQRAAKTETLWDGEQHGIFIRPPSRKERAQG
jgi:crotonobetaine/carnitine-CoA ligase